MWKVQGKELKPLSGASIPLEEKLEDWIAKHPERDCQLKTFDYVHGF